MDNPIPLRSEKAGEFSIKVPRLVLVGFIAGPLALLSHGCATTERGKSLAPGRTNTSRTDNDDDQGFYQPPRSPQFNPAID